MAQSPQFNFRDATRTQAKASILIEGLSGSGKSGLALLLGYYLSGKKWENIYALDTENKSLDLFQGVQASTGVPYGTFKKFDLTELHGYTPSNYINAREAAIHAGAEVFINDSLTHMWTMKGGVLDLVSEVDKSNSGRVKYNAWGDPTVVVEKQKIYATARDSRVHVISTVRVKEKQEMITEDGKTTLKSLGEQQIMMPDFKYEPDLVLHMTQAGNMNGTPPKARVIKSRYAIFQPNTEYEFNEQTINQLVVYLAEGADPKELLEQQRLDLIAEISSILDNDASKRTMFPMLKEQQGVKDVPLKDLKLEVLKTLLGILYA